MEPKEQSVMDKTTIKVRVIENAVMVSAGDGWFSYPTWDKASEHIGIRIERLKAERLGAPKGGC